MASPAVCAFSFGCHVSTRSLFSLLEAPGAARAWLYNVFALNSGAFLLKAMLSDFHRTECHEDTSSKCFFEFAALGHFWFLCLQASQSRSFGPMASAVLSTRPDPEQHSLR